jgi:hypothetical protein
MTNKESLVQQQSCTDLLHFRSAELWRYGWGILRGCKTANWPLNQKVEDEES